MSTITLASLGSLLAVLVAVLGLLAALYRRGREEGRMTEILSQLTKITQDHETRLRALERPIIMDRHH